MPNDVPDWTGQQRVNIRGEVSGVVLGDTGAPALGVDQGVEQISTGGGAVVGSDSVGALVSFKPAAGSTIAQRGALGAFTRGTGTAVNPPWGQAVLLGSLGVAWASAENADPATVTAGWVRDRVFSTSGFTRVAIFHKPNLAAGEAAPAFTAAGGTGTMIAQLGEFTGAATAATTEQTGAASTTQNTLTVAAPAPDAAGGDLVLLAAKWRITNPFPATFAESFSNGALSVHAGDDGGLNSTVHTSFSYAIMLAATTVLPLGIAPWAYDARGTSGPAVGSLASVVFAAVPGKRYVLHTLEASYVQTSTTIVNNSVVILDGVTTDWSTGVTTLGAAGNVQRVSHDGMAWPNTPGNSQTVQFGAAAATMGEKVSAGVYLR